MAEAVAFSDTLALNLPRELRRLGIRPHLIDVEESRDDGDLQRSWRLRFPPGFPLVRANAEITSLVRKSGGEVYDAYEDSVKKNTVQMLIGIGRRITDRMTLSIDAKLVNRGRIAIVIDDFGYRQFEAAQQFAKIPQTITFAILPHHPNSALIGELANTAGHDVIVHLPIEHKRLEPAVRAAKSEPEPTTVSTSQSNEQIRRLTAEALDDVPRAIGANNHMGSLGTEDQRLMEAVLSVCRDRDLLFLDSRTTVRTVAESVAKRMGVRTASRSAFLDNDRSQASVEAGLRALPKLVEGRSSVVAIGHDRPETLAALLVVLPELEAQGYRFVGISEVVR